MTKERQKVVEIANSETSSQLATKRIENALNEWLEKVEEQVNSLDEKIDERAGLFELKQLEQKLE